MKIKKCKFCRQSFIPLRPMQSVCSIQCAISMIDHKNERQSKKDQQLERKAIKEAKEKIKRRGDWVKETQAAVNRFRRIEELSKGSGCISCGRSQQEVNNTDGWKPGGAWDAGHFLSIGSKPELRFEPKNIWLQCKSCNAGSGKYARKAATVAKSYRENLIAREGIELVEWLEGPHDPKKYSIDDLKAIRDEYRLKLKQLKKCPES